MTLAQFIQPRRQRWEQLDALLKTVETRRLRALSRVELKRLGQLYRVLASDLAFAQTNFPQSDVALMLNQLAARTHPLVYRARSFTFGSVWQFYRAELPRTFRGNIHYFSLAAMIFAVAAVLGAVATLFNEEVAGIVLPATIIESIHRHEMWTDKLFGLMPGSIASVGILTNNISVAFMSFALGLTFGIGTCYLLAMNGLMLGCVMVACFHYDMLGPLVQFITAHGVVEISVVVVSGAAGLMLGGALMNPGDYSRRDALAVRGREAVKLVIGTAPFLVVVGMVEGFISPDPRIPVEFKMALGVGLGAAFYLYLLLAGRREFVTRGKPSP